MGDAVTIPHLFADLPQGLAKAIVGRGASELASFAARPSRLNGIRRTKFRDGRLAATNCLHDLGYEHGAVGVGPSGEPTWPTGVVGSISHAREFSVAVAARRTEIGAIGIDIEDDRDVEGIQPYVTAADEALWLDAPSARERRRRLISIFSAKEAVYKAVFPRVGHFFDFTDVLLQPSTAGFTAHFLSPIDAEFPPGRAFLVSSAWQDDIVVSWTSLEPA